jgi:hypothetical protein
MVVVQEPRQVVPDRRVGRSLLVQLLDSAKVATEVETGRSVPSYESTVPGLQRTDERRRLHFRMQAVSTDIDLLSGSGWFCTLA